MRHPRLILTIAGLVAVLCAVPIATAVGDDGEGEGAAAGGNVFAAAALGNAITYQGRLTTNDTPAQGPYDFRFILYDADFGGSQVPGTPTLEVSDHFVSAGLFTVSLDFGPGAFPGDARWLEIAVRLGTSTGAYTPLNPRQPITATPYAFFARNAGTATTATGIALPYAGTNSPAAAATNVFSVTNTNAAATGAALFGQSDSTAGSAAAIKGVISSTAPGGFSAGVAGVNNGTGGLGVGVSGTQAGSGYGVYGQTPSGTGVYGETTSGTGVYGISDSGAGVVGSSFSGTGGAFRGDVSVQLDGAIRVLGAKAPAFVHTVAGGDGCPAGTTLINNPLTNDNPDAILIVTPRAPLHPGAVGVYYDSNAIDDCAVPGEHWVITSLDGLPMVVGEKFNVLVLTQ
ncbi:MAG: hypothetical protein HY875_10315 [Chloroflexi bacterium]|nr:hypothetical protein [Chloroflexota bacterium]